MSIQDIAYEQYILLRADPSVLLEAVSALIDDFETLMNPAIATALPPAMQLQGFKDVMREYIYEKYNLLAEAQDIVDNQPKYRQIAEDHEILE